MNSEYLLSTPAAGPTLPAAHGRANKAAGSHLLEGASAAILDGVRLDIVYMRNDRFAENLTSSYHIADRIAKSTKLVLRGFAGIAAALRVRCLRVGIGNQTSSEMFRC